ncbi:Cobalt-zinc-cadmium resistance protein CzcD [Rubrivivax sp. A210]|uniref:CDF family Co(II)/Ni(II) efflux transporter DmeF n=1 Tax=Rubrivivax sp. A210 TaxID=2772301 RepID=UPI0019194092|nr:CDF family Co(II)/Ni(II) efflux transporter DmeF [Rubrivivax sp. A210]CAD5372547.1 Cobalt-zinc-cadmium resistance protein CzcD [Rubrivivax sp. A210]
MDSHHHDLQALAHSHSFGDEGQSRRERALAAVTALTLLTMLLELVVGWWTGSLALTADGWHMGTHALALGGAVLAYRLSQRAAGRRAGAGARAGYAFGGWKIEVLAAYTSGLVLLAVALWLAWEGIATLRAPHPVAYRDALGVAVLGLVVNLASVWLLTRGAAPEAGPGGEAAQKGHQGHDDHHDHHDHAHHDHGHHDHGHHGHHHGHAAHDHNFSAAYLHVMADALTSLLAIAALAGGAWYGLTWLDPAVALLGAAVIAQWAWRMLSTTAAALVDATEDPAIARRVRELIEADGDAQVADLHVWQVGAQAWCAALSVVADRPLPAADYRSRLDALALLRHVTVEVHRCPGAALATPRT